MCYVLSSLNCVGIILKIMELQNEKMLLTVYVNFVNLRVFFHRIDVFVFQNAWWQV